MQLKFRFYNINQVFRISWCSESNLMELVQKCIILHFETIKFKPFFNWLETFLQFLKGIHVKTIPNSQAWKYRSFGISAVKCTVIGSQETFLVSKARISFKGPPWVNEYPPKIHKDPSEWNKLTLRNSNVWNKFMKLMWKK